MPDNDKNVNVIRPDGSITSLPLVQAKRLEILGYKIETDEEASVRSAEKITKEHYDTTKQRVQAGAEGLLSGATLGLSDLNTSLEERGRAAAHPGTRMASEVVGAFIPDILTFGVAAPVSGAELGATGIRSSARLLAEHTPAGLASRAGRAVEESVGGIGGAVAGNAVQGGLQGAGAAITNAKLSGDPVTTESVLVGAGMGALIGGGAGALGYGASKIVKVPEIAAGKTVTDDAIESILRDEREAGLNANFRTAADAEDTVNDLVDEAKNAKYSDVHHTVKDATSNINIAVKSVESELDTAIANLNSIEVKPTKIGSLSSDAKALINSVETVGVPTKITGTIKKIARENNIAILADDTAESIIGKLKQKGESIEAEIASRTSSKINGGGTSKPEAAALRELKSVLNSSTAEEVEEKLLNYKTIKATSYPPDVSRAVAKAEELVKLKKSAELLKDFPDNIDSFRKMKGSKLERTLAALDTLGSRPEFKSIDTALGVALEDMGLKAGGTASEKAKMLWETKNVPAIEKAERLKVSMPKLESTSKSTNSKASTFWNRAMRSVGARGTSSIARKLGLGFVGGGVGYELGGNLTSGLIGASLFSGVSAHRESVVGRLRNAAARYMPAAGRVAKKIGPRLGALAVRIDGTVDSEKDKKKLLLNRLEEIRTVGPGFNDSAFKIIEPFVGHQDEFGGGFVKSASTAFNTLKQYIPKDPGIAFSRGKSIWTPTPLQIRSADKILAAYHDPVGTVEHLVASGELDTLVVKFIKDAFPGLYGEFQSAMIQRISEPGVLDSMSQNDQAHVGILIGMPLNSSHTPRSIAYSQAMYAKVAEAAVANKPKQNSNQGGRPAKNEPPTAAQSLIQV